MALTCGFFNSENHDRKYNAEQMSAIFNGIINDGIFQNVGNAFNVTEREGMSINVDTGRAWFNSTWTLNDSIMPIFLEESELVLDRIDTVILEINHDDSVRDNSVYVLKGTPGTEPVPPILLDTLEVHQYPLADIYVAASVTEITQADITNRIGTSDTPFITGILETVNIDMLVAQWQAQFGQLLTSDAARFEEWFENLADQLSDNQAANLQRQIGILSQLQTATKTDLVSAINEILSTIFSQVHDMLSGIEDQLTYDTARFHLDFKNGKWGWNESPERGADTFHPFSSPPTAIGQFSGGTSVDIHQYYDGDVSELSAENFFIVPLSVAASTGINSRGGAFSVGAYPTISYNKETGIVTFSGLSNSVANGYNNTDRRGYLTVSLNNYVAYLVT